MSCEGRSLGPIDLFPYLNAQHASKSVTYVENLCVPNITTPVNAISAKSVPAISVFRLVIDVIRRVSAPTVAINAKIARNFIVIPVIWKDVVTAVILLVMTI